MQTYAFDHILFFSHDGDFPISYHYLPIYDNRGGGGWSDTGIQPIYLYVAALHHCQQLPLTCIKSLIAVVCMTGT